MHPDVRAFLQADIPHDDRAPRGLHGMLDRALSQRSADGSLQLTYLHYDLVPSARGHLAVVTTLRTVRWDGTRIGGIVEGREFLLVLPDGSLDEVQAAAEEGCTMRQRTVADALATLPPGWKEDVWPSQLVGTQQLPWGARDPEQERFGNP